MMVSIFPLLHSPKIVKVEDNKIHIEYIDRHNVPVELDIKIKRPIALVSRYDSDAAFCVETAIYTDSSDDPIVSISVFDDEQFGNAVFDTIYYEFMRDKIPKETIEEISGIIKQLEEIEGRINRLSATFEDVKPSLKKIDEIKSIIDKLKRRLILWQRK